MAEFLGIHCEQVTPAKLDDTASANCGACLVINPEVIREWTGGNVPSHDRASSLISPFRSVLIHAVRSDPFHSALVENFTAGRYRGVQRIPDPENDLVVTPDSKDVCGPYAGVTVCNANSVNDRIFIAGEGGRNLISIGGGAHFAVVHGDQTDVFLLGSEDVANLDSEVEAEWQTELFSQFVPHAMALRYVFGEQCWHPAGSRACVIVDDPLLRASYGFLDFRRLLQMMQQHNFSTTLAFIPRNFRRSSPVGVRIFRNNCDRLSLCYHGNDHTSAEFASVEPAWLNTMIQSAERRITALTDATGLHCDRVMVFPQGKFSVEAMAALRDHNFQAVVNTEPSPWREHVRLTIRELAQPAVLRYAGFPLFLRKNSLRMQEEEIAFRLFFGIPLLMVEHHDTFENPQKLIDAVNRINKIAPDVVWSSAAATVCGSVLYRRDPDHNLHVKAYAGTVRVQAPSQREERVCIHWGGRGRNDGTESVRWSGVPGVSFCSDESEIRASAILKPGTSEEFSIQFCEKQNRDVAPVGFRYSARVVARRRLSEIRDNYVSKSPLLLRTAKALQKRIQH